MIYRSRSLRLLILFVCLAALVAVYWLIPIPGQVLIVPDNWGEVNIWPQVRMNTNDLDGGNLASVAIYDVTPYTYVKLIVEETEGELENYEVSSTGVYQWNWSFLVPSRTDYQLDFYHSCHTGCQDWTSVVIGQVTAQDNSSIESKHVSTKLGVVFANPNRDWYGRQAWIVEITYVQQADAEYWGVDDLAARVREAADKGLRVLVRVDYDVGQSIPPTDDYLALDRYLNHIRRLATDDRLHSVYGYIIGSSYNTNQSNSQAVEDQVTPEWYARVMSGYSVSVGRTDNVIQTIRAENNLVRILVGPIVPWSEDQNGRVPYAINVPWLNYFNTLTSAINQIAEEKSQAGITLIAPDGFAVQAPGNPDALIGMDKANEPRVDILPPHLHGAQGGFRVYQDWQDIVNSFPYTAGLPLYIASTNTFRPGMEVEPAQNYPPGWLTAALDVVNQEAQVVALCWFMDYFPHDSQWEFFSLTNPRGQMVNAAEEFDLLLQSLPEETVSSLP